MLRTLPTALLPLLALGFSLAPTAAFAEEAKKPAAPAPLVMASDEEVAEVLKTFKIDYKAKGLTKDDKISQRIYAMEQIAMIQHADVIDALGKVSRSGNSDLRMLAVIYLSEQKLLPYLASKPILASMKKNKKDTVLLLTGLQSLGSLKYLGAQKEIAALLKHRDYVIKKSAIAAVGAIRDVRMLKDILRLIGIKADAESTKKDGDKKSGGKETTEEGYSWEGVEVTYDTGTSGDGDQQMAEKIGKEKLAQNKAAAESAAGKSGSSGGGLSGSGNTGGRGAASRSTEELIPSILRTLKALTGEEFDHPRTIKLWLKANYKAVLRQEKDLDMREKKQKKVR